ncbi:DUF488 family protein [Dictyobacter aurantiacus]|uniref:DUF488 domain-containing protein n=1 Tax=Dictyobacter aurantiacus TaxID=1936993 RepID=A0A401ZBM8_9CHLR|nr:DUF488 family protein [Dictyobacter aurantiacus]GCE04236.1 hypothetical protein KDAU_15650 [Dictyobacter aurantiacus]
MMGSLATFGYADTRTLHELQWAMRVNPYAVIIDTRLVPYCSWSSTWQRQSLEVDWGQRYVWRGDWLGNVNHADPKKSIQLAHKQQGIAWLVRQLERGLTLILLCGCQQYERCHRKVIYDLVKVQLGARLHDFQLGQSVLTPQGPGIIDPTIPLDVHRARNRYAVHFPCYHPQRHFFPDELSPLS